jgi:hypothetical protein
LSVSRLTFVPTATDVPPARTGDVAVVLDTSWTPPPDGRADVVSIRPYFAVAVERDDLYATALATLDRWANATGIADRVVVEGVTYWYRAREDMWHWVHERLVWRHALAALDAEFGPGSVAAAADETALADVVRALGRPLEVTGDDQDARADASPASTEASLPPVPVRASVSLPRGLLRRLARPFRSAPAPSRPTDRSLRAAEEARRRTVLDDRFDRSMAHPGPRIVVLTLPGSYQRVGPAGGAARRDPNLGSVIPRLIDSGLQPVVIGLGLGRQREEDWSTVELDEHLLPAFYVRSRWARPEDRERAARMAGSALAEVVSLPPVTLELDGLDVSASFRDALGSTLQRIVGPDVQQLARIERLVEEVRPSAMLMTQEGHRTPWLIAADRSGVPTFAVQHGVLYPTHAGYADHRHPRWLLPTRTFVFGDYERRVLEGLAYLPGEVIVAGSPRLDLDAAGSSANADAERSAVRRELGVADDARMLVVSTLHTPFVRRSHLIHMLEACLGGPLPGVHVVFKQHPGEQDEGPYRRLLVGLAAAGGYEPPAITLVRDIDLYRLLRAADAHLGQNSTVLTDAVIAGTCNLIAIVEGCRDILGYVDAGVARPIHDVLELRDALRDPRPPDPGARRAFIEDHFLAGDAGARIAASIASTIEARTPVGASRDS